MWTLNHFGNEYQCNGNIQSALNALPEVGNAVANQVPYVNGTAVDTTSIPPNGSNVSFRPRVSGKA